MPGRPQFASPTERPTDKSVRSGDVGSTLLEVSATADGSQHADSSNLDGKQYIETISFVFGEGSEGVDPEDVHLDLRVDSETGDQGMMLHPNTTMNCLPPLAWGDGETMVLYVRNYGSEDVDIKMTANWREE